MAQKIKFSIIQSLFRLFSFLADKTNGLAVFAKPKILLGSVIIGLTATACSLKTGETTCYEIVKDDTVTTKDSIVADKKTKDSVVVNEKKDSIIPVQRNAKTTKRKKVDAVPISTCYDIVVGPDCYVPVLPLSNSEIKIDSNKVYKLFEVPNKPSFPGGDAELYKFIRENLQYPTDMTENGIQGKVYVQFIVEKDGSISNIEVKKSTIIPLAKKRLFV
ncbi:MAG: energy transducer TonB [Prevotellaceae bacterium]|jgi:hypothetical protein|nr:energy transducer TonB [Prevotellaceae bacterium]